MTPREKILDRMQKLDAQLAKFTGALEVLDELGALGEEPAASPPAAEQAVAPSPQRTPVEAPATAAPVQRPRIKPGECFGAWSGTELACRKCRDAANCRGATPQV